MGYDTRTMREYQRRRRGLNRPSWQTLAEDAAILVAYGAGEITEGCAARTLRINRIEIRRRFQAMLGLAAERAAARIDFDERLETFVVLADMGGAP